MSTARFVCADAEMTAKKTDKIKTRPLSFGMGSKFLDQNFLIVPLIAGWRTTVENGESVILTIEPGLENKLAFNL